MVEDPFADDALAVINATDAAITVVKNHLNTLDLDTVSTFPGARSIVRGSTGANLIHNHDTFLVPLTVTTDGNNNLFCTSTVQSIALQDSLAIVVADIEGAPGRLVLVATVPPDAINQPINFIGPKGTEMYVILDDTRIEFLEASATVARIAISELAKIKGNNNPDNIHNVGGPGGPDALAAAVASATTAASTRNLHREIVRLTDWFDSIDKANALFAPGHTGPDFAAPQHISMISARKMMTAALNSAKQDKIGVQLFVLSDHQLEAIIMSRFGSAPGEISISDIRRSTDETKSITLTSVDRSIRDLVMALAITHGPIAASMTKNMTDNVRAAVDLDEHQGKQYATVINHYLSVWHRIPSNLPDGIGSVKEYVIHAYNVNSSTKEILDFKATLVLQAIKDQTAATEKLAAAQATTFKFSHGSTTTSPIRGGKTRSSVSASTSPVRPAKATEKRVQATKDEIEAWEKLRPSFLAKETKVMCKATASGQVCTRPFCRANDAYKAPDDAKHAEVVAWVLKSPFGKQ